METKKILILTMLVFLAIMLNGCINLNKDIQDCGTDELCFADNIEKCQPAKVTFTISDTLGSETKYEEIQGFEKTENGNLCIVYIKVTDENIILDEAEKATDFGKKLIEITKSIVNKDMICKFKVNLNNEESMLDIGSLLKNLDPTTKTFMEGCSGPLKDEIIDRGFEIQQMLDEYENGDITENTVEDSLYDSLYGEI